MFKLGGLKQLTPGDAIDKLEANDPSLKVCDLSKSAVLQMKGPELIPKLAAALAKNTVCQELILIECNINDSLAAVFGEALAKNNVLDDIRPQRRRAGSPCLDRAQERLKPADACSAGKLAFAIPHGAPFTLPDPDVGNGA